MITGFLRLPAAKSVASFSDFITPLSEMLYSTIVGLSSTTRTPSFSSDVVSIAVAVRLIAFSVTPRISSASH